MSVASLARLRDDFRAVRIDGWDNEALELCAVEVTSQPRLANQAMFQEVEKALTTLGAQGWVRLRSRRFACGDGDFPCFEVAGPPLAGEWADGEAASVHLRGAAEAAGLTRWRYAERKVAHEDPLVEGEVPALRQIVKVLRHGAKKTGDDAQAILTYHVFWGASAEDPNAIRRLFSRFVGFGLENRIIKSQDRG